MLGIIAYSLRSPDCNLLIEKLPAFLGGHLRLHSVSIDSVLHSEMDSSAHWIIRTLPLSLKKLFSTAQTGVLKRMAAEVPDPLYSEAWSHPGFVGMLANFNK